MLKYQCEDLLCGTRINLASHNILHTRGNESSCTCVVRLKNTNNKIKTVCARSADNYGLCNTRFILYEKTKNETNKQTKKYNLERS